jgi:actin-related protein 2
MESGTLSSVLFGHEALQQAANLTLMYPMENGLIRDWDTLFLLWEHVFQAVDATLTPHSEATKQTCIVLAVSVLIPAANHADIRGRFSKHFGFRACFVAVQPVLALYSQGNMLLLLIR